MEDKFIESTDPKKEKEKPGLHAIRWLGIPYSGVGASIFAPAWDTNYKMSYSKELY